jgi:hypothetical protein
MEGEEGERSKIGDGENELERGCPTAVSPRQATVKSGDCRPHGGEGKKRAKLGGGANFCLFACLFNAAGLTCCHLSTQWEELRRRARQMESDIDAKLIQFNKVSVVRHPPSHSHQCPNKREKSRSDKRRRRQEQFWMENGSRGNSNGGKEGGRGM